MKAYPIIGLEIHVELKTTSKMFCQCSADYFGKKPNTHVCPVCLGMPGALPVPNKQAVEWTIAIAKALGCTVHPHSKFDRKHYFYPDLPKGYQISQYDEPIGVNGAVTISDGETDKTFRLRRVHLEEDTGKLTHDGDDTLIDFNRSSVPLVEIVTEADFHDSEDVKRFLEELQVIIRTLDVANADMEKGDMRLEPNISVLLMEEGAEWDGITFPKYKVEVKNINSFRFAKAAIDFELKRQEAMLRKGETPVQETRGFDEKSNGTVSQRTKEEAADYRYFPEPDIPMMNFESSYLKKIEESLPELPTARAKRFVKDLGLRFQDAFILTREKATADFFEAVVTELGDDTAGQKVANFIINRKIKGDLSVKEFVAKAKELLEGKKTDESALKAAIEKVCSANPNVVSDYKGGKENAIMFLVGQVMKEMRGQADATLVKDRLAAHMA
jgi:aspartyl-tRNA(Asn)/glutamyl-tRNA(Gln) amidotransferase subunit B